MGPIAKAIYKKLASMVATKHNQSYSQTISWLQCRFSFSLYCSSIMCLRGSCFYTGNPQFTEVTIDRTICDSRVNSELDMNLLELIKLYSITLCFLISLLFVKVMGSFPLKKRKTFQGGKNQLPWW